MLATVRATGPVAPRVLTISLNDLSSWDETKRLVTHLRRQHEPSDPDPAGSMPMAKCAAALSE
jgi:hypothetical protein